MNYFYISKKVKDWSKYEDEKIITLEWYKIIITLSVKKGSIPILSINHTCKTSNWQSTNTNMSCDMLDLDRRIKIFYKCDFLG